MGWYGMDNAIRLFIYVMGSFTVIAAIYHLVKWWDRTRTGEWRIW